MFYYFELNDFPAVTQYYSVTRNTVWSVSSAENLLIIITKGRCRFSFDSEEFISKEGDAVFIPANRSYLRTPVNKELCSMTYIHFVISSEAEQTDAGALSKKLSILKQELDSSILSGGEMSGYPHSIYLQSLNRIEDAGKINDCLTEINLFSPDREIMCFFRSSVAICRILIYLSQTAVSGLKDKYILENEPEVSPNLKKAIGYIRKNYSDEIRLCDLASCCSVSKQQVIRYFKAAFNKTPIRYVLEYKIARAKDFMLFQPHLTVKEIAAELGFDDQHYFSKMFKKITGETPTQYKYRIQNYVPPDEE